MSNPTGVKGLYLKAGKYVYQAAQKNGFRPKKIYLRTSDLAVALELIVEINQRESIRLTTSPLADLIEEFYRAKIADGDHRSALTTRAFKPGLNRFKKFFCCSPQKIGSGDVIRWRNSMLAENLSRASVVSYLRSAQSFMSWLASSGKILKSPFDTLPKKSFPKAIPTKRARFCSKDLRDRLIRNCEDPDLKAVLFFGFHTGMRRGEILAARKHWLLTGEPRAGLGWAKPGLATHIHVQNEGGEDGTQPFTIKDGEPKIIPITRPLAAFIEEYGIRSPYLIKPEMGHGTYLYRWEFKRSWAKYMKEQGCPWVSPHTMRHTFITLLLSAQPDKRPSLLHIERWTGTGIGVLKRSYAHLIEDPDLINAAN